MYRAVGGNYDVSVFVTDDDGLPFKRAASVPKSVEVQRSKSLCDIAVYPCF